MPIAAEVPVQAEVQVQDSMVAGGREGTKRERKSVNYAEPKLNTKMRRPDPPPGTVIASTRKRDSASTAFKSSDREEADVNMDVDMEVEADVDIETDAGPRSSSEYSRPPPPSFSGRSKAAAPSRQEEDDDGEVEPTMMPLPVSRPPVFARDEQQRFGQLARR
jgi:hypothetical protein